MFSGTRGDDSSQNTVLSIEDSSSQSTTIPLYSFLLIHQVVAKIKESRNSHKMLTLLLSQSNDHCDDNYSYSINDSPKAMMNSAIAQKDPGQKNHRKPSSEVKRLCFNQIDHNFMLHTSE